MANILIVENDENLRVALMLKLKSKYDVQTAANAEQALKKVDDGQVDLVVTDVVLPDVDGYNFVETLRLHRHYVPVIILTAKNSHSDKRKGFAVGTDDYMTKPVNFEELIWRIDALLRRSKIANEDLIVIGDVVIDRHSYSVKRGDEVIVLPSKEFKLLFLMLSYPGKIFTKENILDSVWGYSSESDEYTVRTHINRLRKKFEGFDEFEIVTIRGIGYKAVVKK
jgi:DNA-binding response OmpR family regulator